MDYDAPFECEHLIYTAKVPADLTPLITAFSPNGLFEATQELYIEPFDFSPFTVPSDCIQVTWAEFEEE